MVSHRACQIDGLPRRQSRENLPLASQEREHSDQQRLSHALDARTLAFTRTGYVQHRKGTETDLDEDSDFVGIV